MGGGVSTSEETVAWLLAGDPAVVWRAQRDLLGLPEAAWGATRARIAQEGWGAALLAARAPDGTWGGGLYSPKWTSTFYTLRLLTQLGVVPSEPAVVESCRLLLTEGVTDGGGVSPWTSPSTDTCVTAMLLWMASALGLAGEERCRRMVGWLLDEQMPDGGWNCRGGATHASFHTSISALEGLTAYAERAEEPDARIPAAVGAGRAFFLEHQLYRSSSTGRVIRPSFSRLFFPPRWYFDVLRGLEHFVEAGAPWDERLRDPMQVLVERGRGGRWRASAHSGRTHLRLEPPRQPSRLNTARALRVLAWAESA